MDNAKEIVKEKYGQIAGQNHSEEKSSCGCGSSCCGDGVDYTVFSESYDKMEGYNPDADLGLGCGIPTEFAGIKTGDTVVDLGSGAGNDCFVARALVGETGKIIGIDMTEQMIERAKENVKKLGYNNVEFRLGDIEEMPVKSGTVDVVISNCVLNLVPDKSKAFNEISRVLKSGGRFCVSDVVIRGNLPEKLQQDAEMYAGCVSGAIELNSYMAIIETTGFTDIVIHKQKVITLPEELLSKYLSESELSAFKNGDSGIFSITVSASIP